MEQKSERNSPLTNNTSPSSHSPQLYSPVQSSTSNCPFHSEWVSDLNYNPGTIIGRGSFGQVFKATHKRTEKAYALKIINKALVDSPNSMSMINREIDILSHIDHPHIIRLLNHFEDSNSIYILMPYLPNG